MSKWRYENEKWFYIPADTHGFTYKVTLFIDEKVFKYYGKKKLSKRWQLYNTSSEIVQDLLCMGADASWEILGFYSDAENLHSAEVALLKSIRFEHDYEMWLNRCFTSTPTEHADVSTLFDEWRDAYAKIIDHCDARNTDDWFTKFMDDYPV